MPSVQGGKTRRAAEGGTLATNQQKDAGWESRPFLRAQKPLGQKNLTTDWNTSRHLDYQLI